MLWSSNEDFAIRITALHEGQDNLPGLDSQELNCELPIVHSFKCHVDSKLKKTVTCAFASDGYMIHLVTFEKEGRNLKEIKRRQLKMFKNLSGLKIDFDDNLLAVSGELFTFSEEEVGFDRKSFPGIAIYNLSDSSELIAGHISSKELGFNPSEHNHDLRIVQRHNVSMVGVRGYTGEIEVYELREPQLIFNNIEKADLETYKLVLNSFQSDRYQMSTFFALDPTDPHKPEEPHSQSSPQSHPEDPSTSAHPHKAPHKAKPESTEDSSKNSGSLFWIIIVLLVFAAVYFYLSNRAQADRGPQKKEYEMTADKDDRDNLRESQTQRIPQDNSVFDKTA